MAYRIEQLITMNAIDKLALANAKRKELQDAGVAIERLDPIEKARRNPTSLRMAINGACWSCAGGGADGVGFTKEGIRDCTAKETCSLWNVRPYQATSKTLPQVSVISC